MILSNLKRFPLFTCTARDDEHATTTLSIVIVRSLLANVGATLQTTLYSAKKKKKKLVSKPLHRKVFHVGIILFVKASRSEMYASKASVPLKRTFVNISAV